MIAVPFDEGIEGMCLECLPERLDRGVACDICGEHNDLTLRDGRFVCRLRCSLFFAGSTA